MRSQNEKEKEGRINLPPEFNELIPYLGKPSLKIEEINQKQINKAWKFLNDLQCQRFSCYKRKQFSNLLKNINHINFSNLKYLELSSSGVTSVEGISHINAPILGELFLIGNKIIKIKDLSKGNFRKLWRLAIHKNMVADGESMVEAPFKISHLSYDLTGTEKCQCENVNWLMKYQTSFECLWIKSSDRIFQTSINRKIREKHSEICLYNEQ